MSIFGQFKAEVTWKVLLHSNANLVESSHYEKAIIICVINVGFLFRVSWVGLGWSWGLLVDVMMCWSSGCMIFWFVRNSSSFWYVLHPMQSYACNHMHSIICNLFMISFKNAQAPALIWVGPLSVVSFGQ